MNKPNRKALDKAKRKYLRLESRNARRRTLSRLANKCKNLFNVYMKKLILWREWKEQHAKAPAPTTKSEQVGSAP